MYVASRHRRVPDRPKHMRNAWAALGLRTVEAVVVTAVSYTVYTSPPRAPNRTSVLCESRSSRRLRLLRLDRRRQCRRNPGRGRAHLVGAGFDAGSMTLEAEER